MQAADDVEAVNLALRAAPAEARLSVAENVLHAEFALRVTDQVLAGKLPIALELTDGEVTFRTRYLAADVSDGARLGDER